MWNYYSLRKNGCGHKLFINNNKLYSLPETAVATELDDVVQKLQNSFFVTRRKEQKVLEINE